MVHYQVLGCLQVLTTVNSDEMSTGMQMSFILCVFGAFQEMKLLSQMGIQFLVLGGMFILCTERMELWMFTPSMK